jgi:hypothetical protein
MIERLPSVTEIIGSCNSQAFADVPLFHMERAQARGTVVHADAAAYLQGLWYDPDPTFEGYHQSLVDWTEQFVSKVGLVEKELVDLKRGFKGHPDAILLLRGDTGLTLLDLKTPKPLSLSWRLQLAGYRLLAQANGFVITRVASLRLDKDGGTAKFQGYTKTLAADQNVFLSALNVWKFYNLK